MRAPAAGVEILSGGGIGGADSRIAKSYWNPVLAGCRIPAAGNQLSGPGVRRDDGGAAVMSNASIPI